MGYEQDKEERIRLFKELWDCCERSSALCEAVCMTRRDSVVFEETLMQSKGENYTDVSGKALIANQKYIIMNDDRDIKNVIIQSMQTGHSGRVGILYTLSGTKPGNDVIRGGDSAEAELCRNSTLYFCLQNDTLKKRFYEYNRNDTTLQNNARCVYLPEVVYIYNDLLGRTLSIKNNVGNDAQGYITIDVIGTAMPDADMDESELYDVMHGKLKAMLRIAENYNITTLIVGSVFKNIIG